MNLKSFVDATLLFENFKNFGITLFSVYLRGHTLKKDFQACVYNLRSFAPIRWNDKAMLSIMRFHGRFAINVLDLHTNPCG